MEGRGEIGFCFNRDSTATPGHMAALKLGTSTVRSRRHDKRPGSACNTDSFLKTPDRGRPDAPEIAEQRW